ncbi:MAG: hypothetical protein HQ539_02095 [Parcubacteria group bacterium]|nr:hypothetical protein [Parcubacteria group bacterium]
MKINKPSWVLLIGWSISVTLAVPTLIYTLKEGSQFGKPVFHIFWVVFLITAIVARIVSKSTPKEEDDSGGEI